MDNGHFTLRLASCVLRDCQLHSIGLLVLVALAGDNIKVALISGKSVKSRDLRAKSLWVISFIIFTLLGNLNLLTNRYYSSKVIIKYSFVVKAH